MVSCSSTYITRICSEKWKEEDLIKREDRKTTGESKKRIELKSLKKTINSLAYHNQLFDSTLNGMDLPKNEFEIVGLKCHNEYRALHNTQPLEWSNELTKSASEWARLIARVGVLSYADTNEGENLAIVHKSKLNIEELVRTWYLEIKHFDFNNPNFTKKTAHFTQLIWDGTRKLGLAKCLGADGYFYVVARYYPPGNFQGRFKENVKPIKITNQSFQKSLKLNTNLNSTILEDPTRYYQDFECKVMLFHNKVRRKLELPQLIWDTQLADFARLKAETYFKRPDSKKGLKIKHDRLVISFRGRLPRVVEVLKRIYEEDVAYKDSLRPITRDKEFFPIRKEGVTRFGCSQVNDSRRRFVCVLIYAPGNLEKALIDVLFSN
ncbi:Golgi-associated plant pathogenesis-related protein 1 [Thelohanellus kitauei]|uniref:Golgi-associated plant pathogenesis-related protein 1 n=1 Tax=Thelohanellus kitauei TaxID=669202 RepID=A0A0C2N2K2_THEKT|nr:Golgi-associated plant pathogenesis-related protein 1 [Thelohanellus kitauei]